MELFVFTDNMVFESVFYKGASKTPLLFEIVLRLNQVHMRGYFILHVIHIVGKRLNKEVTYGLSRGENLVGMMRGSNPLHFLPLYQGVVDRSTGEEALLRLWWVKRKTPLGATPRRGRNIIRVITGSTAPASL